MRCSRSTMGSSKYEESNGSLICESVTQSEKVVVPLFVLSFSPCVWTQGLPNLAKLHSHAYPPNGSPLQIISTNQWSHTWSYPRTTISLLITDRIETRNFSSYTARLLICPKFISILDPSIVHSFNNNPNGQPVVDNPQHTADKIQILCIITDIYSVWCVSDSRIRHADVIIQVRNQHTAWTNDEHLSSLSTDYPSKNRGNRDPIEEQTSGGSSLDDKLGYLCVFQKRNFWKTSRNWTAVAGPVAQHTEAGQLLTVQRPFEDAFVSTSSPVVLSAYFYFRARVKRIPCDRYYGIGTFRVFVHLA